MTRLVEDHALRVAFKRGDLRALEEVYREYARPVLEFLEKGFSFEGAGGRRYRFQGCSELHNLESLAQDVFVHAFAPGARDAYDGLRPYRNYLFAIARNLVVDSFRSGSWRMQSIEEVADRELDEQSRARPGAEPEPDPEEAAIVRELEASIEAFMGSLSPEDRAVFEVRLRQGLSVEEAARRLGVSEHRIKRSEKVLKKRFFNRLRDQGFFEGYRYGRGGLEKVALLLLLYARTRG